MDVSESTKGICRLEVVADGELAMILRQESKGRPEAALHTLEWRWPATGRSSSRLSAILSGRAYTLPFRDLNFFEDDAGQTFAQ